MAAIKSEKSDRINWLFLPGGPGLPVDVYKTLWRHMSTKGKIFALDLYAGSRRPATQNDKAKMLRSWRRSVEVASTRLHPAIVVGHSFSSMLILDQPNCVRQVRGLVLISAAPNGKWLQHLDAFKDEFFIRQSAICEMNYRATQSNRNFRRMWSSWAPYYFGPRNLIWAQQYLLRLHYNAAAFELGEYFWPKYKQVGRMPSISVNFISGSDDKITPLSDIMHISARFDDKTLYHEISKSGHFPWIDEPQEVARILRKIEERALLKV